jgi:hypothetical protein
LDEFGSLVTGEMFGSFPNGDGDHVLILTEASV